MAKITMKFPGGRKVAIAKLLSCFLFVGNLWDGNAIFAQLLAFPVLSFLAAKKSATAITNKFAGQVCYNFKIFASAALVRCQIAKIAFAQCTCASWTTLVCLFVADMAF
jgi:hypothetical protein